MVTSGLNPETIDKYRQVSKTQNDFIRIHVTMVNNDLVNVIKGKKIHDTL